MADRLPQTFEAADPKDATVTHDQYVAVCRTILRGFAAMYAVRLRAMLLLYGVGPGHLVAFFMGKEGGGGALRRFKVYLKAHLAGQARFMPKLLLGVPPTLRRAARLF